jgi:asparagine synthetase B (glutamine-hydrolysing)
VCGILVSARAKGPFSHRQLASLKARGPDAIGFWSEVDVNIAQTRLAIIGLHDRGTGPIENATHVLAYNG